jgi:hypothetical protein
VTNPTEQARRTADALGLLLGGYSPEEVERILEGTLPHPDDRTALSDPTNVLMQEVTPMAQPTARGPVDIKGVTTRTNTSSTRTCEGCLRGVPLNAKYERVARDEQTIESYHVWCFADEFGERRLYGD